MIVNMIYEYCYCLVDTFIICLSVCLSITAVSESIWLVIIVWLFVNCKEVFIVNTHI